MINVLLIVKDFNYGKNLINKLARINKNFRICGISNNKEESIFILNNMQVDIVIIELPLNNYEEIVKLIGNKRTTILISDRKNEVKIIDNIFNNGKMYYFIKNDNIAEDATKINCLIVLNETFKVPKMCKVQELKIKQKINGELKYLGYNLDHLGSKYIAETIYMLYIVKEYYNFNLERDIYPVIAKKIGKSVNNVKCNIKNATEIMYYESEEEKIMKYLENNDPNKPKPKKIIKSVLKKIK